MEEPLSQPYSQDEPADYLDLEIQDPKAYKNLKGDFLDHGHAYVADSGATQLQFPLYDDQQLSFLDQNTKIGAEISRSIVKAEFDDDVATDDDMKANAERLLNKELAQAIDKYTKCKNKGELIKNHNVERRFRGIPVWQDSDNE